MIEIEFLPVGSETNTGDAILCHFAEPGTGVNRIVLIDGGFSDTADQIVSHVRQYYGTITIDLMVCTHPDDDHINGLFGVLEQLEIRQLLVHRPSSYGLASDDVKADRVDELIDLAVRCGTAVTTRAFAGASFFGGALTVVGPSEEYYQDLLREQKDAAVHASGLGSAFRAAARTLLGALTPRRTDPGEGELSDHGGTSARNNSSIILDLRIDGYRALFTGDAGAPALSMAADFLDAAGLNRGVPDFFDVPHHGSRHNLTTGVLNRLAGPVVGDIDVRTAFVSVGAQAKDFPRPEVANAFKRRGYQVSSTQGRTIRWSRDAGGRLGWTPLTPLPWFEPEK